MNDELSPVQQHEKRTIELMAKALVERAKCCGFRIEISPRPLQPLAMRNYELVTTVWPDRK